MKRLTLFLILLSGMLCAHAQEGADTLAQHFTAIISQCDEAQYSPVASAQMSDVYSEGVDLISRIEAVIKR